LHVRAILGLPIPSIRQLGCAVSYALIARGNGSHIRYHHLDQAFSVPDIQLRLFGKPNVAGERRVGVVLSLAENLQAAREKAQTAHAAIEVNVA
jgi:phosphoribosylglycinamide formyltransferase 2